MNTARVIQLRPTQTPPLDPEEANRAYQGACAAFLRSCFERFPTQEIKRISDDMGWAEIVRFEARKGRRKA